MVGGKHSLFKVVKNLYRAFVGVILICVCVASFGKTPKNQPKPAYKR